MAAEADTVADDTLNGHYFAAAASAAAVVESLPQSPIEPRHAPGPPSPPLITSMPSAVTCKFVGEGSANVVFSVAPANDVDNASRDSRDFQGLEHATSTGDAQAVKDANPTKADAGAGPLSTHLLRIPKAGPGVSPTTCLEHHAFYSSVLRPLLGAEWLVGQHLVQGVVSTGVNAVLDGLLADLDRNHRRRPDWVGARLASNVDVALLVEDMTSASPGASYPSTTTTIQCKPKWLVQSPSAPAGARRCRTCALSAASAAPSRSSGSSANGHAGRAKSAKVHKIKPCPMVLVADPPSTPQEEAELEAALWDYVCKNLGSAVASSPASPTPSPLNASSPPVALLKARPAIIRWLRTTDLFNRMAAIQAQFDPHGAISVGLEADDGVAPVPSAGASASLALDHLQTAMTLRDCTCFLRVATAEVSSTTAASGGTPISVSAKLGDLDRKDGRRKLARWQAQERTLIEGGFYLGTEEPRQQTHCWLERQRG